MDEDSYSRLTDVARMHNWHDVSPLKIHITRGGKRYPDAYDI